MNTKIVASVLSLVVAWPSLAADRSQWSEVQSLRLGDRIRVTQPDGKRIEGRFESAAESAVTLRGDKSVTLSKNNVVRVENRRLSRGTKALIGLGVGAGVGGTLGGGIAGASNNEGFFGNSALVAVMIVATSALGAGFGALSGSGYKTIYRRDNRP
jgi:hypothetical protein